MKITLSLRSIVITALIVAVLAISLPAHAASFTSLASGADANYVPGEVLVKFKPAISAQERKATVAAQGHSFFASLNQPGWAQVKVGIGQTMDQALAAYQNDPNVEYVQPNYIYHATAVPNDPQYTQLWAFKNSGQTITTGSYTPTFGTSGNDMNIENAWTLISDCSSIVVAVVDTGVNYNQEDLAGNMWSSASPTYPNHGYNFVDTNNDPMDLNGHGTHVAGIIGAAGNNATGTTGVCWTASIMAVRVLDATGSGYTSDIISGINFAVTNGAKVINMSLAGSEFDQLFSDAITDAQNIYDAVVVVAAGNEGANNDSVTTPAYPCNFTQANLVCVAALDQNYALASFSNYGATSVDVGAPGTNILSTWTGTDATINDHFNTGGILNWTTSGGGWAYGQVTAFANTFDALVDPGTFPAGTYSINADNRVFKTFDLSGKDVAVLRFYTRAAVQADDYFNIKYRSTSGDPFLSGVSLAILNGTTNGLYVPLSYDLSPCISATCSVGFQLFTSGSGVDAGVGILGFSIQTLALNTTSYNTISGTSMATPEVAGLAAMLRAYNPLYTYTDTVNAIKNGGRPTTSLTGKTSTGKAIDVMKSLAYINPPSGLTATVY